MNRARAGICVVLGLAAGMLLSGCTNVVSHVQDQQVQDSLDQAMHAMEKYAIAHGGSIHGASLTHLAKYGFVPLPIDKHLEIKTSTDVVYCLQVTAPSGTTYKDRLNGELDSGVVAGTCIEGQDYD